MGQLTFNLQPERRSLTVSELTARIRDLLAARAPAYASAAHTIDTTGLTVGQVVERVRTAVDAR